MLKNSPTMIKKALQQYIYEEPGLYQSPTPYTFTPLTASLGISTALGLPSLYLLSKFSNKSNSSSKPEDVNTIEDIIENPNNKIDVEDIIEETGKTTKTNTKSALPEEYRNLYKKLKNFEGLEDINLFNAELRKLKNFVENDLSDKNSKLKKLLQRDIERIEKVVNNHNNLYKQVIEENLWRRRNKQLLIGAAIGSLAAPAVAASFSNENLGLLPTIMIGAGLGAGIPIGYSIFNAFQVKPRYNKAAEVMKDVAKSKSKSILPWLLGLGLIGGTGALLYNARDKFINNDESFFDKYGPYLLAGGAGIGLGALGYQLYKNYINNSIPNYTKPSIPYSDTTYTEPDISYDQVQTQPIQSPPYGYGYGFRRFGQQYPSPFEQAKTDEERLMYYRP